MNDKSNLKLWLLILFFPYIAVVYIGKKKTFKSKLSNNLVMMWCVLISFLVILDIGTQDDGEINSDLTNQIEINQHIELEGNQKELAKAEEEKKEQEELAKAEEEKKEQEELAKAEEEKKEQEELAKAEEEKKEQEELAKAEESSDILDGFKPAPGNIYPSVKLYAQEDGEMVHYFTVLEIGKNVTASTGYVMEDAIKVKDAFTGEEYWKDREKMLFLQYQLTGEYMYYVAETDPNLK